MSKPLSLGRSKRGCDSCEVLRINGVLCHETGCPKSYVDPGTGKGYKKECRFCGRVFCMKFRGQDRCHVCAR